ncbi:hypothetical protein CBA19CS22_12555 [Caballeronia novacaledonica]|jgi:hypothetical protein|uniref:Uncharacterized protein n=1 Tax=Caballeronia novacaledonica TaxID=1544861 RepID=A0ACB5QQB5_9BURK|nr:MULTISPECIES: hypothetical protein [Caballeronia]MDR5747812.1 hypothetical protein [Caballeronia sp. LZ029]GJH13674.1 hypothetical protein CBA19CS11_32570 [Caballeronia novacaledonica]GJH17375.1 hypothetical protein CBA19CS22_12555 [Caballeronia novacaledonica]
MLLTVDPTVLDFREDYPWLSIDLLEAIYANPNIDITWKDVPCMDFVVTMRTDRPDFFRHVIVSHKMENHQRRDGVQEHLQWEQDEAREMGWGYCVLSRGERWEFEVSTASYLISLIEGVALNDVHEQARVVAELIETKNRQQPLDRLLDSVSKVVPCDLNSSYAMFAASVCLGFLSLDLTARCGPLWPLKLASTE